MQHPFLRLGAVLSFVLLAALPARAQDALQSPEAFLGYELGERFTPHHRVLAYAGHVAEASPYVALEPYGTTYEGRELVLLFVGAPELMARREQIRTDNLKRAGVLEGAPEGPPTPIVWLSYNVHGNESSSSEAAMATLYALADPQTPRTKPWLDDALVVIDPMLNPDGRDRYVHFYNETVGRFPNANPDAREHREPWPGGRTNHYYFDLNRDWAWGTQVETRQRLEVYNRWLPQVHVDFHEQGVDAPYYFAPAAEPFHAAITDWQRDFQTAIGRNHTRYFDDEGWLYFTRERFDLLYPGYGDTWPTFNGAIGMTYEQAGHGRAGLAIETQEGDTLTLRDRLLHHTTTGLSTIEATATRAEEVVEAFTEYYAEARTNPGGAYEAYVIKPTDDGTTDALAAHLAQQGIRFGVAEEARTASGFRYQDGTTGRVQVEPGDLVVSAYQPKGTLVRVLMEPETVLPDSLTYDITAWALPYAYDVEAYALTERLEPDAPLPAAAEARVTGPARPYAYLAAWSDLTDARFLAALLRAEVKLRYATQPFTIDGRTYGPGTLIVTRTGNDHLSDFDAVVRTAAAATGQPLRGVATGFVEDGQDFGSGGVRYLEAPRVAVMASEDVYSNALGEVWHFFDQQLGYPVTLLDGLRGVELAEYDVLVLPAGSYGDVLGDDRLSEVKAWVRGGGRIVALERAAGYLADQDGFTLTERSRSNGPDTLSAETLPRYGDRERARLATAVPGAVYRVQLDPTHPLAFGYDETSFTLKRGDDAYAFLKPGDGWNVGVLADDAHVSGFVGHEAQAELENTVVFGVQPMGAGEVVYLVDNPLFRGFWHAGKLLFSNAVFMGR